MIFQYNPSTFFIENSPSGELLFTICLSGIVAPQNPVTTFHDLGGVLRFPELHPSSRGTSRRRCINGDPSPSPFPIVYLYGRSNQMLSFYGAMIGREDVERVLDDHPSLLRRAILAAFNSGSPKVRRSSKTTANSPGAEAAQGNRTEALDPQHLRDLFMDGLSRQNQDFRSAAEMFSKDQLRHSSSSRFPGPVPSRDARRESKTFTFIISPVILPSFKFYASAINFRRSAW